MTTIPTTTETPAASSAPVLSPHAEFTAVRDRLLTLEHLKANGGTIDLKEVQSLVSRAAELTAIIQTSTTGPKKKSAEGAKAAKAPKEKKPSSISHLQISDSFDDL